VKRWGLCWWAWALAATAVADTHYVSPTGTCIPPYTNWVEAATNIQDAVSEASDGDVVEVAAGTYESTGVQLDEQPGIWNVVAVTNAIELRGDFTATIQPPMSAPGWIRCVYLCSNAILSGFNLSDGRLADGQSPPGTDAAFGGGGVYGPGAIVTDCTIQDCVAPVGGAVCGPTVLNCTLLDNWAGTGGGAISAHLANCWMNYNRAQYDGGGAAESRLVNCGLSGNFAGGQGGGLFMGSATGCIFQGAAPGPGGGIGFATYGAGAAQSTLDNCTLQGLVASFEGGGAYNCQLTACSIIGNQANSGGGVAGLPYNTRVTSCTVQGNWASRSGGGIYGSMVGLEMMQIPVENCIIEANSSGDGAGVSGSCLLTGCTVRANTGSAVSGSSTLLDCLINGNMGGVLNPVRMERCTLSGNSGRVLEAFMASSTLIRDCVIVSNYFSWTGGTGTEGGLSSLSLINTRIEDNDGQLVMSQCTVEGSRIAGNELLTMLASDFTNCVIEANTCQSTDGCDFFDCTISGNTSSLSAIRNSEVWRSTITGNWGDEAGAGIDSSFHDCTISSNRSPKMAAVGSLYGGPPTQFLVIGCLLEGNVQVGGNIIGGIAGFVGLTDCRILNNISEGGSTLYYCNAQRCLIAGNRAHLIGGANGGELRESTVVNNVASNGVGGAEACSAFDSIIYHNTGAFAANWTITNDFSSIFSGVVFSHCCTDPLRADEFADETGIFAPAPFRQPLAGRLPPGAVLALPGRGHRCARKHGSDIAPGPPGGRQRNRERDAGGLVGGRRASAHLALPG
jgi:hypothetical protein